MKRRRLTDEERLRLMYRRIPRSGQDVIPPHNLEAEMALLGSLLVTRDAYDEVKRYIKDGRPFYAHVHETLCDYIYAIYEQGLFPDKITLAEKLQAADMLEKIGGLSYISSLMDTVQTALSAGYYAKVVADKYRLRCLMDESSRLYLEALNGEEIGAQEVATDAMARIEVIAEQREDENSAMASMAAYQLLEHLENPSTMLLTTPWEGVNSRITGFSPGELTIIGSNPGMGKSGAVNSLTHYWGLQGKVVAQFCLEMGKKVTMARYASMLTEIKTKYILAGTLSRDQKTRIGEALEHYFAAYNIMLYDRYPMWSVADIHVACRKLKRQMGKLDAVFVDHVGFLSNVMSGDSNESIHHRLDNSFKQLLNIGAELDCSMFAVQHMNRSAKDGLPSMFDLRDGGNPEGNAHTIIIPWRANPQHEDAEERAKGLFICEKVREGEPGPVKMRFWGARGMWVDEQDQWPWWQPRRRDEEEDRGQWLIEPPPPDPEPQPQLLAAPE